MKYEPAWDGLRAIAVLCVLFYHAHAPGFGGGALGVDMFFVLSGYLITRLLIQDVEKTGRVQLARFFGHRVRRLAPALYVMLAVVLAVSPFLYRLPARIHFVDGLAATTYWMDFLLMARPGLGSPLNPTWSLAVEAQFYLLWPFVVMALARLQRRTAFFILLAGWAAMSVAAGLVANTAPTTAFYAPWFHSTGLLLGAAVAFRTPSLPTWLGWPALIAAAIEIWVGPRALTLLELTAGALIVSPPSLLRLAPLVRLGRISYGVYLWHVPILVALGNPWGWPGALGTLAATIMVATASWMLVERRFIAARRPMVLPPVAFETQG